jgi:transposase
VLFDDGAGRRREAPMSFRELTMVEVRDVLRRFQAGQSARQVAREGWIDRKTAGRYFAAAQACGVDAATTLDDAIVAKVAALVQTRPELPPSEQWVALEAQRARIEAWLFGERRLRLVRVHELLAREGVAVSYTTLREFARQALGWRTKKTTVRVDDPPFGEEAQVDFGLMGRLACDDGKVRKLWALVVTLTASRYMFVWPLFAQTTAALCEGLDAAWRFFGGVPKRIVPDNMGAAIVAPDASSPRLQQSFLEYADQRGLFVDPARVRRPQDKARVENQIAYVRERCFDGETFVSLEAARAHSEAWCRDVAGMRIHGTTRCVPREVYERDEKPRMQPAPTSPFDVPVWTRAKVHPDHHVQVDKALYSVPTKYVGAELQVRIDRATVRLYRGGELVKAHGRVAPGKRSTDPHDYPQGKADYALRSVDRLRSRAHELGEHVGAFVAKLVEGPLPWTKMRAAYGVLRLCDRYGAPRVDAYCARALAFDVLDTRRIERMLQQAMTLETEGIREGSVTRLPAPTSRFARDTASFATRPRLGDEDGGAR